MEHLIPIEIVLLFLSGSENMIFSSSLITFAFSLIYWFPWLDFGVFDFVRVLHLVLMVILISTKMISFLAYELDISFALWYSLFSSVFLFFSYFLFTMSFWEEHYHHTWKIHLVLHILCSKIASLLLLSWQFLGVPIFRSDFKALTVRQSLVCLLCSVRSVTEQGIR